MMPYTEYALICYKEPWLSTNNVLGTAYSDGSGAVSIKGKYDVTTKFICNKYPTPTSEEYQVNGTRIWLVPTDDLTFDDGTAVFIDWAPTEITCSRPTLLTRDVSHRRRYPVIPGMLTVTVILQTAVKQI